MHIVRVQVDEMAAPVLALRVDGAIYDVAALEEHWGVTPWSSSADFYGRVFSARAAGLDVVDARLRSGDRPASARVQREDLLPLPPVDVERANYVQAAPFARDVATPAFVMKDTRSMVGDGQPVPLRGGPHVELGLAALLGDDLDEATPREAARAVLGLSLIADWAPRERWTRPVHEPDGPTQLGPALVTGLAIRDLARMEATVSIGQRKRKLAHLGRWRHHPTETLAFISRAMPLRTGDVVGLGALCHLGPDELRYGDRVTFSVRRIGSLTGWAVPLPTDDGWRLRTSR